MTDRENVKTIQFSSPEELARHLYDRAVKPSDGVIMRLRIAVLASNFAVEKWKDIKKEHG